MATGVSANAFAKENSAFLKWKNIIGKRGKVFQAPMGADAGFPDFGFRIVVDGYGADTHANTKRNIDVHVEYKANHTAQMGSMRDWIWDGRKFKSPPGKQSEQKEELLSLMNGIPEAKRNAKRMLTGLKRLDKQIVALASSSLTPIKDQAARRELLVNWSNDQPNYTIAKIESEVLGNAIMKHYSKKFKLARQNGADISVMLMMIGDKVWEVETHGRLTSADREELLAKIGLPKFDRMRGLTAALECRIQPRGLNSPNKPVSIDVMANFRLKSAPTGGQTISQRAIQL